jgi:serine/threonine protein phosphatase 1
MRRLFAISDIHGCYKPFYELIVNTIELTKSDQLILLGDYIDRGEQSKEVIDFILELKNLACPRQNVDHAPTWAISMGSLVA